MLSDCRVGTICPDQDVAVVGRVVRAADHDSILILEQGHDLLARVDPLFWDLAQQQVIEVWPGNDVPRMSRAILFFCFKKP